MKRIVLFLALLLFVIFALPAYPVKPPPAPNQVEVVNAPALKGIAMQDNEIPDANALTYNLVNISGPGTFCVARITLEGLWDGVRWNSVELAVDGNIVVQESLGNLWRDRGTLGYNPLWATYIHGGEPSGTYHVISIKFPLPVSFDLSLDLNVIVVDSAGTGKIRGTVIYGE
jgi:hypothetical protein